MSTIHAPGRSASSDKDKLNALAAIARVELHDNPQPVAGRIFPTLLLAVFFVALLLALIAGVSVYTHVTNVQNSNNEQRESLGVIVNTVRANDATGAIARGKGPEGDALVIEESTQSGTYETRVYSYGGQILQEYSLAGSAYTPEKASVLAESGTFDFAYSDGVLSVTTDQGTAEVALRFAQGGN